MNWPESFGGCAREDELPEDWEDDCSPDCPCYEALEPLTCKRCGAEYYDVCADCMAADFEEDERLAAEYWKKEGESP